MTEEERFLCAAGRVGHHPRDRLLTLNEGEFVVIPKGVEHKPVADDEAHVLLAKPASTQNAGNVRSEQTVDTQEHL